MRSVTDLARDLRRSARRWRAFAPVVAVTWCAVAALEALITLVVLGVASAAGFTGGAPALEAGPAHSAGLTEHRPFPAQLGGGVLSFAGGAGGSPASTPSITATPAPKPPLIWPALGRISQPMWAKHAKGAHLHFELREDGAPVDPLRYLAPP